MAMISTCGAANLHTVQPVSVCEADALHAVQRLVLGHGGDLLPGGPLEHQARGCLAIHRALSPECPRLRQRRRLPGW